MLDKNKMVTTGLALLVTAIVFFVPEVKPIACGLAFGATLSMGD